MCVEYLLKRLYSVIFIKISLIALQRIVKLKSVGISMKFLGCMLRLDESFVELTRPLKLLYLSSFVFAKLVTLSKRSRFN